MYTTTEIPFILIVGVSALVFSLNSTHNHIAKYQQYDISRTFCKIYIRIYYIYRDHIVHLVYLHLIHINVVFISTHNYHLMKNTR